MSDPWVETVQQWLNDTYTGVLGWDPVEFNGVTGWPTMYALTRALQYELGITTLSNNFGAGTISALSSIGEIGPSTSGNNMRNIFNIAVGGLYCKGYNGDNGNLVGEWTSQTTLAVKDLQNDIGIPESGLVSPKLFKAILNMDAYVVIEAGTSAVREVQRWMNATYLTHSWFFIVPADGSYSRDVQTALVYAIQTELGVAGANGNYGPGTRAAVSARAPITPGSSDSAGTHWVQLFQGALRFNGYVGSFDGSFSNTDSSLTSSFQSFACLPTTGNGDFQTWSSLLVSNGDPGRAGQAADMATPITAARAAALVADGRLVVGRYLTNASGSSLDKKIQPGELHIILSSGLNVFPIFETWGISADYFSDAQGFSDAGEAVQSAASYGFKRETVIYFAVDCDPTGAEIAAGVVPYFEGINRAMSRFSDKYRIGVYGTRNVCARLASASLAVRSFVAGMSYGYSGNLGFQLPPNWAFDQISTITVGTGAAEIEIDNDVYSGRDSGQNSIVTLPSADALDVAFDMSETDALAAALEAHCATVTTNTDWLAHGGPTACLNALLQYDTLVTQLAASWGIRKALIQCVAFWEYWKTTTIGDQTADGLVMETYAYYEALEAWEANPVGSPPLGVAIHADSSTGFAQIFAATAIWAHNWSVSQSLAAGTTWDGGDWHVVWKVWQDLHDDVTYNLSAVPAVLMTGAADVGISGDPRLDYTAGQVTDIIARYNNTAAYGVEVKLVYDIFESFNAALR